MEELGRKRYEDEVVHNNLAAKDLQLTLAQDSVRWKFTSLIHVINQSNKMLAWKPDVKLYIYYYDEVQNVALFFLLFKNLNQSIFHFISN